MRTILIGTISLDNDRGTRAAITLRNGRLWCDGNDISPIASNYCSIKQARRDAALMYRNAVWAYEAND